VATFGKKHWIIGSIAFIAVVIALVLALGLRQASVPMWRTLPPPAALPMASESGLAPVDDIMMWYAIYSKDRGNPVLLVHGGTSNAETWGNQVPALMRNHEVILGESRGHGRSTRSKKPYTYQLMADDYIGLLDYLKIDKVALVGWSDGGIIGLDIAMRHPERLTKLWAYGANTQVTGLKEGFERDPVVVEASARQRKEYERLSPTPDRYDGFVAAINHMWNTQPDYKATDLAKIVTPAMIVDGQYDEFIKREHTEEVAHEIPGATFLFMPNVGHWGHWQNPALYNRELIAFLDAR
jgi:pimeloyl-ACP methyl ester carboxylesterase